MAIKLLAILLLYLSISFVLTALYVRFRGDDSLAGFYRKRLGLFPSFPVVLVMQIGRLSIQSLAWRARELFELLSGKPTYRRRKINYYGQRRKTRGSKSRLQGALETNRKKAVRPASQPGLVNDNEVTLSAVSKVASRI